MNHTQNLNVMGEVNAPVLVICDAPGNEVYQQGRVMPVPAMNLFGNIASYHGFAATDFMFVTASPPIPEDAAGSAKREGAFIAQYTEELWSVVNQSQAQIVIYLGALAGKQIMGRPVQVTKARGQVARREGLDKPILPFLSPAQVLRLPEMQQSFQSDFGLLQRLRDANWNTTIADRAIRQADYRWVTDISDLLANPPRALALDTETIGYEWFRGAQLLTVQMTWEEGRSIVLPVHPEYWERWTGRAAFQEHIHKLQQAGQHPCGTAEEDEATEQAWQVWQAKYPALGRRRAIALKQQIKELLANPRVHVAGHNLKYDVHALRVEGIEIANWYADTMQLAFCVDENMQEKSLDECTRRWVPAMAGYADVFNKTWDKSRMDLIPPDDLLPYAGGDTDACWRLSRLLLGELRKDSRQLRAFEKVQMPALRTFAKMEQIGVRVDQEHLADLGQTLKTMEQTSYDALIQNTPAEVRRKHVDAGLSFSRAAFTSDILFTNDGFGLRPLVFTKGSTPTERIPSVSAKTHLPFHIGFKTHTGFEYVRQLIEYSQLQKLRTTYVGMPAHTETTTTRGGKVKERQVPHTGFWQYIAGDGRIHPSFFLHDTVTGRSSSRNPNAQNFPKRGAMAAQFRRIFRASPGYQLCEVDLSQAELRIAAWMANEHTMLDIYQQEGDIHTATAAAVLGLTVDQFLTTLSEKDQKKYRFQAKAVNFGFLYGMGWRKFKDFAKTDYKVDFTDAEAEQMRVKFFNKYPQLPVWHTAMREFARRNGYVRSLHGAIRHLPSVHSPDEKVRSEAERQAINSPVQRFASDLGLLAMSRLARDTEWDLVRPLMFIHDALVCEVRSDIASEAGGWVKHYMETPPLQSWFGITAPLPIRADVSLGENLGEMEERKDIGCIIPHFFQGHLETA